MLACKIPYMKNFRLLTILLCVTFYTGHSNQPKAYEDLALTKDRNKVATPGQVYRMGESGICGTVESDHIKVTHVVPGSVAEGKIRVGDLVRGMQHRGMGGWGGIPHLTRIRIYRLGRDWDWHFFVTVERPSLRRGKGNTITYDLKMTPSPGQICHYGPTGFFAERHSNHLVIDIIEKGSPSDGLLKKGDVILSVNGKPITPDAYDLFTKAIDQAESHEGKGILRLLVKRSGDMPSGSTATITPKKNKKTTDTPAPSNVTIESKKIEVTLRLKVLGQYSKSSPVNCKKTDALITQTADEIIKHEAFGQLNWGLLGLLSTGEEKYIKVVHDFLHDPKRAEWAQPPEDPNEIIKSGGYVSWHFGYRNLLMTEYYLATGDKFILPAIAQLSKTLAVGQDQAGLWGHRMAHPEMGRAYGYGIMNQPSIHIFISLILAKKCGINDPKVLTAIKRTHDHYEKWIGQGALPYGNHGPTENEFTNNGTSGSLAVAFALMGNQKGATFYGSMSASASEEILLGHGGPKWNILWSGLGANTLGPEMTKAYNNKLHWLRTITRTWSGGYTALKGWGSGTNADHNWSTGSHLINLSSGRRKISITGKGMDTALWVNTKKAEQLAEAMIIDDSSEKSLLSLLGSPWPPVRLRAAQTLAKHDAEVSDEIITILTKGTPNQRVGAIHAIQNLKIDGVVDELLAISMNEKDDLWVRRLAIRSLSQMKDAKKFAPKLLEMLVRTKPYDRPYGELDISLGQALVLLYQPDPYATELDKELFYKGVVILLNHQHASGRGAGMQLIKNIPREDLVEVVDKMVYVIQDKDKTYTSYNGSGRQDALEILYRHGIKESMDLTINTIKGLNSRGSHQRARKRLLKTFGAEAKLLIPQIKEVLGKDAESFVKQIEASTTTKKMITLDDLKKENAERL